MKNISKLLSPRQSQIRREASDSAEYAASGFSSLCSSTKAHLQKVVSKFSNVCSSVIQSIFPPTNNNTLQTDPSAIRLDSISETIKSSFAAPKPLVSNSGTMPPTPGRFIPDDAPASKQQVTHTEEPQAAQSKDPRSGVPLWKQLDSKVEDPLGVKIPKNQIAESNLGVSMQDKAEIIKKSLEESLGVKQNEGSTGKLSAPVEKINPNSTPIGHHKRDVTVPMFVLIPSPNTESGRKVAGDQNITPHFFELSEKQSEVKSLSEKAREMEKPVRSIKSEEKLVRSDGGSKVVRGFFVEDSLMKNLEQGNLSSGSTSGLSGATGKSDFSHGSETKLSPFANNPFTLAFTESAEAKNQLKKVRNPFLTTSANQFKPNSASEHEDKNQVSGFVVRPHNSKDNTHTSPPQNPFFVNSSNLREENTFVSPSNTLQQLNSSFCAFGNPFVQLASNQNPFAESGPLPLTPFPTKIVPEDPHRQNQFAHSIKNSQINPFAPPITSSMTDKFTNINSFQKPTSKANVFGQTAQNSNLSIQTTDSSVLPISTQATNPFSSVPKVIEQPLDLKPGLAGGKQCDLIGNSGNGTKTDCSYSMNMENVRNPFKAEENGSGEVIDKSQGGDGNGVFTLGVFPQKIRRTGFPKK